MGRRPTNRGSFTAQSAQVRTVVKLQIPFSAFLTALDNFNRDELVVLRQRVEERLTALEQATIMETFKTIEFKTIDEMAAFWNIAR